ncbi:hypothetical protein P692DRAFT_20749478, partial [Suillus brevipes Sb2]
MPIRPPPSPFRYEIPRHSPTPDPPHLNDGNVPAPLDADERVLMEDIYTHVKRDDLRHSLAFISQMQAASLDDEGTGLSAEAIMRLKFPPQFTPSLEGDRLTTAAIKLYISCSASDKEYERTRKIIIELQGCAPDEFPTLYQVKQIVAELTGVESIVHEMCIDSCVGFTGPFAGLTHCPECGKCRYDEVKFAESGGEIRVPRKQFSSIPVGPQLQALYRDPKSADAMRY